MFKLFALMAILLLGDAGAQSCSSTERVRSLRDAPATQSPPKGEKKMNDELKVLAEGMHSAV
ncbi:hypothetical protein ABTJ35_18970, partial [Acinetobacter baumannii]